MESPGKFLKREREIRSISLEQISNFTKVKEHHLRAIEEDRYELLPPVLYVKGFLTGYARYLALDPKNIVLQYEKYLKSLIPPEPVELEPEAPPRKKVRQWFLFSLVAFVILSACFVIYSARRPSEKKLLATSLPLISPSPAIQSETGAQPIYQAEQNQSLDFPQASPFDKPFGHELGGELLKAPSATEGLRVGTERRFSPHPEVQKLHSTQDLGELSRVAQADGAPLKHQFSEPERATTEAAKEEMPALKVLEAGIGTGVERDGIQQFLTGKCSGFGSNNQRGYFFTRIKTQKEGKIAHVWMRDGKECYRVEIDVKPPAWSVYSYFTFRPQHAGNWRAEARDGGHVLTSLNFNVVQSSEDRSL